MIPSTNRGTDVPFNSIAVVGGGAWGTALAHVLASKGLSVRLWAFEPETVREIGEHRTNSVFLPGISLSQSLEVTGSLAELGNAELVLLVAPAQHLGRITSELGGAIGPAVPLVICSKGIEQSSGRLLGDVVSEAIPGAPIASALRPELRGGSRARVAGCLDGRV